MMSPVVQRGAQHWGLCAGQTSTPTGATSLGLHRPYGVKLFQMRLLTSPPQPKFTTSPPTISVWPHQKPQKTLSAMPPPPHPAPQDCTTMGLWLPLSSPMRPPGLAKTVIYLVQERIQVRSPVPQCGKWWD